MTGLLWNCIYHRQTTAMLSEAGLITPSMVHPSVGVVLQVSVLRRCWLEEFG